MPFLEHLLNLAKGFSTSTEHSSLGHVPAPSCLYPYCYLYLSVPSLLLHSQRYPSGGLSWGPHIFSFFLFEALPLTVTSVLMVIGADNTGVHDVPCPCLALRD